ncbi:Carbonic anhydrase 6 [Camponotus floridanus]|uniref:Carbonic anhydrase 6 n=2 Tax=Camponotus floridanus TaxID=104421 RepID=E2AGD3_CAMFO|nr:Carbonic anhydrase 6 [Camponotus floridanus]
MHLHWSAEHTVDGLGGPLELHLVHYDKQYANSSIAAQHEDGIAVVSCLFELSKHDNQQLEPIVKATREILYKVGKSTAIQKELIPLSFLPKNYKSYYQYQGSLTTPACQESVKWFVLEERSPVSTAQVNVFKRLKGDHGRQTSNNRPTQELNDRKVYHYLG